MWIESKKKSFMIKIAVALTLLTLFMQGCTNKELVKPITIKPLRASSVLANLPDYDFNKTAKNETEAAMMAWELYKYIRELEINLEALKKDD